MFKKHSILRKEALTVNYDAYRTNMKSLAYLDISVRLLPEDDKRRIELQQSIDVHIHANMELRVLACRSFRIKRINTITNNMWTLQELFEKYIESFHLSEVDPDIFRKENIFINEENHYSKTVGSN